MDHEEAKKRIEKLKEEISELNYEYFVLNREKRPEAVRDSLKKELKTLEEAFPDLITKDSPTQRVGSVLSGRFKKVKHKTKKWSLADVFSKEELQEWADRIKKLVKNEIEYVCELKIDGLNIAIWYEKGKLIKALTRGNGFEGEDVTHTVKTIESVPLSLKEPIDIEVSGEVYMSKAALSEVNKSLEKEGKELLANPRNAAAGAIRQLDPSVAASRKLSAFFYEIGEIKGVSAPSTQEELLKLLMKLGFSVNQEYKKIDSIGKVIDFYKDWQKKRDKLPYDIDGLVVKVNDKSEQKEMGYTGKAPRHSIAFKFPAEQVASQILDIIVQVGRTGAITPVAIMKPTEVSGSVVSRATLHNESEMERKDIRIGDTVVIQKAGDVIPEVVEVIKKLRTGDEKKFHFPHKCPICGGKIVMKNGEKIARCINKKCYAQNIEWLKHFVSKGAFNIEGAGDKVVVQLVEAGLVRDPSDFFKLKKEDLLGLDFFKDKRADNLLNSIEKSKKIAFAKFLFALGIRYFGEQTSDDLVEYLVSHSGKKDWDMKKLINKVGELSLEELGNIDGVGEKVADSLYSWFHDGKNIELLERFDLAGIQLEVPTPKKNTFFSGKTCVLTGTLENMTRDQAKNNIKDAGGRIASSVSKDTDFLIVGAEPGSKYKKAKEIGIKIIDEKKFLKMLS